MDNDGNKAHGVRVTSRKAPTDAQLTAQIGSALSAEMDAVGLTGAQLGERLGVHQTTVDRWRAGANLIPLDRLFAVEVELGLPAGYLLRSAGLIEDPADIEAAIQGDARLGPNEREIALNLYRNLRHIAGRPLSTRPKPAR